MIQDKVWRERRRRSLCLLCAAHARQASHCPEFDSPATFCAATPEWRLIEPCRMAVRLTFTFDPLPHPSKHSP
jgi:hypothetical protein